MMEPKIRVYGKAQNRIALGIIRAYVMLHPETTLDSLREEFPHSICPDSGVKENFVDLNEVSDIQGENWNGFFDKEPELIPLADGTRVAITNMWTAKSLARLVAKAADFGIEVGTYDASMKDRLTAGYWLEKLSAPQEPAAPKKKGCLGLFILFALFTAAAVAGVAATIIM